MTTSRATTTLDYDALRESLRQAGAVAALPEVHGGVCGALCAGGAAAAERWLALCLEDLDLPLAGEALEGLRELVAASWRVLAARELVFEPLLPDDDAPLDEQVQAIALWCQGFLAGVGLNAPAADQRGGIDEILNDFAEISRAALSDEEAAGHGAPDFALAEIHEYVRVSVQIVFEELTAQRGAGQRDLR